jgi:ankyrin repeat protein
MEQSLKKFKINLTFNEFISAIIQGKRRIVEKYLDEHPEDINKHNSAGDTPLISSLYHPNINIMKLLVSRGADVNGTDQDGNTALHVRAMMGNYIPIIQGYSPPEDYIKFLIESGANVNHLNKKDETPMDLAIDVHNEQKRLFKVFCVNSETNECGIIKLLREESKKIQLESSTKSKPTMLFQKNSELLDNSIVTNRSVSEKLKMKYLLK